MALIWTHIQTPIQAYTINTGKTVVYESVDGRTALANKIYDTDLCTIDAIYACGWCKVTFPLDAGGMETGYVKTDVFFDDSGFTIYASKNLTAYRRSDLGVSSGQISAGDKCYVLKSTSTAVQIAYPSSSGGYKIGWISLSDIKINIQYNANGASGTMKETSVVYTSTLALASNSYSMPGYTFEGWNLYRQSDKTWYVAGQGWKTANEISANGFTKSVYRDGFSCPLDWSWVYFGEMNDTLTFYAVWERNTLTIEYNANGAGIESDRFTLENGVVSKNDSWLYNETHPDGLYNASTFGLTMPGYTFMGWGTTPSGGTVFDQDDGSLHTVDLCADILAGDQTITLYAIWEKNATTQPPVIVSGDINANGTVDADDVLCLFYYISRLVELDDHALGAADYNGDGVINLYDAARLFYMVNGLV